MNHLDLTVASTPHRSETPHGEPRATADGSKEEASSTNVVVTEKPRRPRGFAAMDRTKVSEIASKGGKAAHAAGTAHQFTSDEARNAGRKGGVAPHVRRGRGPRSKAAQAARSSDSSEEASK